MNYKPILKYIKEQWNKVQSDTFKKTCSSLQSQMKTIDSSLSMKNHELKEKIQKKIWIDIQTIQQIDNKYVYQGIQFQRQLFGEQIKLYLQYRKRQLQVREGFYKKYIHILLIYIKANKIDDFASKIFVDQQEKYIPQIDNKIMAFQRKPIFQISNQNEINEFVQEKQINSSKKDLQILSLIQNWQKLLGQVFQLQKNVSEQILQNRQMKKNIQTYQNRIIKYQKNLIILQEFNKQLQSQLNISHQQIERLKISEKVSIETKKKIFDYLRIQNQHLSTEIKDKYKQIQRLRLQLSRREKTSQDSQNKYKKQRLDIPIQFINGQLKPFIQLKRYLHTKEDIFAFFKDKKKDGLKFSSILEFNQQIKNSICSCISELTDKKILRGQLIFKMDQFHKDFSKYVLGCRNSLLVIIKLANGLIFTAYSEHLNQPQSRSFLSSFFKEFKAFHKNKNTKNTITCRYESNYLVFGSNELKIKNNAHKNQLLLNFNSFGNKIYNIKSQAEFLQGLNNNVTIQRLQVFEIYF